MAAISVNDGGTWRTPWGIYVNDGGTWRTVQEVYVNDAGTWRTVFQSSILNATMTEGDAGGVFLGYIDSVIGSMDAVSITGGNTLRAIFDDSSGNGYLDIYAASDPGATFVSQCTVSGTSKLTSAATYSNGVVGANVARWLWSSTFGIDGSGTSSVVLSP